MSFTRYYSFDPGLAELIKIEGVVKIDREPPAAVVGTDSGTVCIVGEFENGPFNSPTNISSGDFMLSTFGGFGFSYAGVVASNPCARSRKADAALLPEFWNGNGAVALKNKQFRKLFVVRVDTSVGEVSFTRRPAITGNGGFSYDLEPGQTIDFDSGIGPVTATFNAATATINSAVGAYPWIPLGGETIVFKIEGVTYTATFLASDTTQAATIARMNAAAGYAAFVNAGGGVTTFSGRVRGTSSAIEIVSIHANVATATGFAVGSWAGTGNVANIDQVTVAEANTVVNAADSSCFVDRDANQLIRMYTTGVSLQIASTSTATAFGFAPLDTVVTGVSVGVNGNIPAGTRVRTAGGVEFVTMQDIAVTAGSAGPYKARARHALDDGTGAGFGVSLLNVMPFPINSGAWTVTNDLPISAALSEGAIDAAYVTAIDKTKDIKGISKDIDIIFAARQSNLVRTTLRLNALDATAGGAKGRHTVIRPPLGTTRAKALSSSVQPGVGAYRDERVKYTFPGVRIAVPEIAARGLAGGAGFTTDGVIDVGSDAWLASIMSLLNPEENPGQQTSFTAAVIDIENNPDVQALQIGDYVAFKANGIAAPVIDSGATEFQSGVTSVDPATTPQKAPINRLRMSDTILDSLAVIAKPFVKKLGTKQRRAQLISLVDTYLRELRDGERIEDYSLDGKSGNTSNTLALGIYRIIIKVRLIASMDVIVFDATIGQTVEISVSTATP